MIAKFHYALTALEYFFFPLSCAICGSYLSAKERDGLCDTCKQTIDIDHGSRCHFCGRPLLVETEYCLECRSDEVPSYKSLIALFPYHGKGRSLLAAYKFGEHRALTKYFAAWVIKTLRPPFDNPECPRVIVPVPPRPGKIKRKGWDQIDLLLTELKREGIPVSRCLCRLKSNSQKALNRHDRRENLKNRIICVKTAPKTVTLLDDIITTGATLRACAACLLASGAIEVHALTLFYD